MVGICGPVPHRMKYFMGVPRLCLILCSRLSTPLIGDMIAMGLFIEPPVYHPFTING